MKLLFIVTQGEWGGAQRYVYDLATHCASMFDVTVVMGEPNGKKDLQEKITTFNNNLTPKTYNLKPKIKIIQLRHLVRPISPLEDIAAVFELASLYKKEQPDIVHLNSSKAGVIGSFAKKLSCIIYHITCNTIYTVHGWIFNENLPQWKKILYQTLEHLSARWKDVIIVLSPQDEKSAMSLLNIPKEKIFCIPLGIDTGDATRPLSKEAARAALEKHLGQPFPKNNLLIGTIANLYPNKGIDVLIEAARILSQEKNTVQFIVIGDGQERQRLESTIKQYHLEKQFFLAGKIPDAAQLLPAFDMFVLASRKEGLPFVILEAFRAGVPVIATDVGGVPSLIDNKKNGIIISPDDPKALADDLRFLASHQDIRTSYADASLARLSEFSSSAIMEKTTALYRSQETQEIP